MGQTAIKTAEVLQRALDGVLFIDEAYALSQGGKEDYGAEAIATLIAFMENNRDRLVVIVAGYKKAMDGFLGANAGLRSRFSYHIDFADLQGDDFWQVFLTFGRSNQVPIADACREKVIAALEVAKRKDLDRFGNGRDVRNLFERVLKGRPIERVLDDDAQLEICDADLDGIQI